MTSRSGRQVGAAGSCAITGRDGPGPKSGNLETTLGKESFLQKTGGHSGQSPNRRWLGTYLNQVPALEGLCDDGRNGWTDAPKHHQVVRPVLYCVIEGFQSFRIITLGSNTQKEKPELETAFPRGKSPTVDSHKQTCLVRSLLGLIGGASH